MSAIRPAPFYRVTGSIICIVVAFGIALSQESRDSEYQNVSFGIDWQDSKLSVSGNISSEAHETILRRIATDLFAGEDHAFVLTKDRGTPPGWGLLTELTLRAVSYTYSAKLEISARRIEVRGITTDLDRWQVAAMRVNDNLIPGMKFESKVREIQPVSSLRTRCTTLFQTIWRGQSIAFPHGSDQVKSSAYAVLDELVQLAADCPGAKFTVTGHTDNTGNEAGNLVLSLARADSVVSHMVARGIVADRLYSHGAGSSEPLLDEDSRQARQLNRRIEIDLNYR